METPSTSPNILLGRENGYEFDGWSAAGEVFSYTGVDRNGPQKMHKVEESEAQFKVGKTGNVFGLSWELRLRRRFADLADFPGRLGAAARVTEDQKFFEAFVTKTGPNTNFFKAANGNAPSNKILNRANLRAAWVAISKRKYKEGNPVSWGGGPLNLVVPRTLLFEAEEALVPEIVGTAGDRIPNPLYLSE